MDGFVYGCVLLRKSHMLATSCFQPWAHTQPPDSSSVCESSYAAIFFCIPLPSHCPPSLPCSTLSMSLSPCHVFFLPCPFLPNLVTRVVHDVLTITDPSSGNSGGGDIRGHAAGALRLQLVSALAHPWHTLRASNALDLVVNNSCECIEGCGTVGLFPFYPSFSPPHPLLPLL